MYDYKKSGLYLVTLRAKRHSCFSIIDYRNIIESNILYFQNKKYYKIIIYNILPNHIHFLLEKDNITNLTEIIRKLKSKISTELCQNSLLPYKKFWQKGYWDRIVRVNEKDFFYNYIKYNHYKHKCWNKDIEYPGLFRIFLL